MPLRATRSVGQIYIAIQLNYNFLGVRRFHAGKLVFIEKQKNNFSSRAGQLLFFFITEMFGLSYVLFQFS